MKGVFRLKVGDDHQSLGFSLTNPPEWLI